ncbi:MAG: cytochrome b5 domain-containing protein [Terriglobus roseus]|nr:cytochrome b5 domain-containing protein [Terriglobus roseus]
MSESKELTYEEVAEHNTKKDLYLVIHDKVYNSSSFVDEHPYVQPCPPPLIVTRSTAKCFALASRLPHLHPHIQISHATYVTRHTLATSLTRPETAAARKSCSTWAARTRPRRSRTWATATRRARSSRACSSAASSARRATPSRAT